MAFWELREYEIRPGKMEEWIILMEDEIIPFQVAQGMVIAGMFRGESDDGTYVWIRRFDSEADRERLYEAVYKSSHWLGRVDGFEQDEGRCQGDDGSEVPGGLLAA